MDREAVLEPASWPVVRALLTGRGLAYMAGAPDDADTPLILVAGGRPVMGLVARFEDAGDGWTLHVLAAGGGSRGLAPVALDRLERLARAGGAARVRFETRRPGLVRLATRRGYRAADGDGETILTWEAAA